MKTVSRTAPARPKGRAGSITVLVVDDHHAVRRGVRALLEEEPGIEVDSAASYREAVAVVEARRPAVAVVDFHLPDRDGLRVTRRLKAITEPPRVLVFSAYADQHLELAALIAGADGVLSKGTLGIELCDRVWSLARGAASQFSISPETLASASYDLDLNDRPILSMLVNGTPPRDIAGVLGTSEEWLDTRRWAILQRLQGAAARAQAGNGQDQRR